MTMKRLEFKKQIYASATQVYEIMLGLNDKKDYQYWTSVFNPTSTFEGNWNIGNKILFVGLDEKGKKGGMVSKIVEHEPAKLVKIEHYGFVDGELEITSGEIIEKWAGGNEIYHFEEKNQVTTVTVELDTVDEYITYFNEKYPKALEKLKERCEA